MHPIIIQHATSKQTTPKSALLRKWARAALSRNKDDAEVTIRTVGIEEMTYLNTTYRHKAGPTNVLSFPFATPNDIDMPVPILGDIVICPEVVSIEAAAQGKLLDAHWAHMVVHGVLHLLGYDHIKEEEAKIMEALEVTILKKLGFPDPYQCKESLPPHD